MTEWLGHIIYGARRYLDMVNGISQYDDFGSFLSDDSDSLLGAGLAYGISIPKAMLTVGVAAKYIRATLPGGNLANGVSADFSLHFNPFMDPIVRTLTFYLVLQDIYSYRKWTTGYEDMLSTTLSLGAHYSVLNNRLTFGLGVINTGTHQDVFTFQTAGINFNVGFAVLEDLILRTSFNVGDELTVSMGLYYNIPKVGFINYLIHYEDVATAHSFAYDKAFGEKKKIPEYLSDEYKKRQLQKEIEKIYARAMGYFARSQYKESRKEFEALLELDPKNETARGMLKRIEFILSLEEDEENDDSE